MKLKVEFNKFRRGQNYFSRSLTVQQLDLLLISCDDVEVNTFGRRKTGEIMFIYKGELNRFAKVRKVPFWVMKKFLPETEWKNKMEIKTTVKKISNS